MSKEESESLLLFQVFSLYTFYVPVMFDSENTDFDWFVGRLEYRVWLKVFKVKFSKCKNFNGK